MATRDYSVPAHPGCVDQADLSYNAGNIRRFTPNAHRMEANKAAEARCWCIGRRQLRYLILLSGLY
jgi:hypothetical protein